MKLNDETYDRAARVVVNTAMGDGKNRVFFDSDPAVKALQERFLILEWTDLPVVRELTAQEKEDHPTYTHVVEDELPDAEHRLGPNMVNLRPEYIRNGPAFEQDLLFALGHLALVLKREELAEEYARSREPIDLLIKDIAEADPNSVYDVERIAAELAKKYKRIKPEENEQ